MANKDFSGMRRVVARFNFSCNLTGNRNPLLTIPPSVIHYKRAKENLQ